MTDLNEIAGYVIVDVPSREAIWGYGASKDQAWGMFEEEPPDWEEGCFEAYEATAELLDLVDSRGGNVSYRIRGGVAMS